MAALSTVTDGEGTADGATAGDVTAGTRGGTRQLPVFFCPYCGDEELTPHDDPPGSWYCGACLRAFTVRLIATGVQSR